MSYSRVYISNKPNLQIQFVMFLPLLSISRSIFSVLVQDLGIIIFSENKVIIRIDIINLSVIL
jgi:hypothetical protein